MSASCPDAFRYFYDGRGTRVTKERGIFLGASKKKLGNNVKLRLN
nr:MAG TPA: hypothetical protein [Caudoviricetes sp.]